ncbi:response regulator [Phenylobacterium sp.]|uniref:response regulator n=1 Tax=Phenylobacterium sp. TaxID=1871053 RepID=UPI0035B31D02
MSGQAVTLLLVEDSPQDLELTLRELLASKLSAGVKVLRDGAEALDFLFCEGAYAERPPELGPRAVFLDLKLPKVDGLEVLRRIKADPRTQATPVVVLSSSREERDVAAAYAAGANSYVVKPVNFDQFSQMVRQVAAYWLRTNHPPEQE